MKEGNKMKNKGKDLEPRRNSKNIKQLFKDSMDGSDKRLDTAEENY